MVEELNTSVLPIIDVTTYQAWWCDDYYIDDWNYVKEKIMECARPIIESAINEVLRCKVSSVNVRFPRAYNFEGDVYDFNLTFNENEFEALKERCLNDDDFIRFLKDKYSSRDGFHSYMANNVEAFEEQDYFRQIASVLSYLLIPEGEYVNEEYQGEFEEDIYEELSYEFITYYDIEKLIDAGVINSELDLDNMTHDEVWDVVNNAYSDGLID